MSGIAVLYKTTGGANRLVAAAINSNSTRGEIFESQK
jgi:hypothetical protein